MMTTHKHEWTLIGISWGYEVYRCKICGEIMKLPDLEW